jgi:hypothetical protein
VSDKIYDINFGKAVRWNIRRKKRKPKILALLNAMAKPIALIHRDFLKYRKAKLYQLMITPQKCYLERLLNDRYDFTQRRIYIDDGIDHPPTFIYRSTELKPLYIYRSSENKPKKYIYTRGESGDLKDDFIVFVPLDISFESAEMISLIKQFKLAGTKFKIQRF